MPPRSGLETDRNRRDGPTSSVPSVGWAKRDADTLVWKGRRGTDIGLVQLSKFGTVCQVDVNTGCLLAVSGHTCIVLQMRTV